MINAKYFMDKDFEKSSIANEQPRQKAAAVRYKKEKHEEKII